MAEGPIRGYAPGMSIGPILVALLACVEYEPRTKNDPSGANGPAIELSPETLDFGLLPAGETAAATFTISSVGETTLLVRDVRLGMGPFTLPEPPGELRLTPGASAEVSVIYTSGNPADAAWVSVFSDSAARPEARVQLLGGTIGPAIALDPPAVHFGPVLRDTVGTQEVRVLNLGTAPLTVTGLSVVGAGFSLDAGVATPFQVEPGADAPLALHFSPPSSGAFTGTLWVESDAPTSVVSAPLDAQSGQPIAVCRADPPTVDANAEPTDLIGSDSYDAEGGTIVAWDWTLLSRPPGSGAVLPTSSGAVIRGFRPDLAGAYEVVLVVTNDAGLRSEPCVTVVDAVPSQDLWVELSWEHAGDDMDLHVVAPGGELTTSADCYFANCVGGRLDWGAPGNAADNPHLDLDDIPGTGPENINIAAPAAGVYTVYVHDYPGTVYESANEVWVRIFLGGTLAWEGPRILAGENTFAPIAEIDWPAATVTPL
jgi:hypothetical protein